MNSKYGSLEIYFTYIPEIVSSVSLITNINGSGSFSEENSFGNELPISVRLSFLYESGLGAFMIVIETLTGSYVVDRSDYPIGASFLSNVNARIFFYDNRVSVYINKKWIYSYNLGTVSYPDVIVKKLSSTSDMIVTNIVDVEICDGREAIFVDYESTSDNAMSSIILDRPIEIFSSTNRAAMFTYGAVKEDVNGLFISSYSRTENGNSSASSDGLVYSSDVGISIDKYVAKNLGLITRMYRLSDLDSGVERAVTAIQRKARQSRISVSTSGRFDPRLEVADVQVIDANISGTLTRIQDRVIVENVSISIGDGNYSQSITARREVDSV